jgi:hypothetical protein
MIGNRDDGYIYRPDGIAFAEYIKRLSASAGTRTGRESDDATEAFAVYDESRCAMAQYRIGMRVRLRMTGEEFEVTQVLENDMLSIRNDNMSLLTSHESVDVVDGWRNDADETS